MSGTLDGRVVIITGAGRGIGASVSRLFAEQGAKLVVNDLGAGPDGTGGDEGPARDIADEIVKAGERRSATAATSPTPRPASGWSTSPSTPTASSTSS